MVMCDQFTAVCYRQCTCTNGQNLTQMSQFYEVKVCGSMGLSSQLCMYILQFHQLSQETYGRNLIA